MRSLRRSSLTSTSFALAFGSERSTLTPTSSRSRARKQESRASSGGYGSKYRVAHRDTPLTKNALSEMPLAQSVTCVTAR